jgi:hypothetical protein
MRRDVEAMIEAALADGRGVAVSVFEVWPTVIWPVVSLAWITISLLALSVAPNS